MSEINGLVIVRYDDIGNVTYYVAGDSIRLFIVDERAPNDRVYEWLSRDDGDTIRSILRDDKIGSSQDDRHAAIKHKVLSMIDGKKHLALVADTRTPTEGDSL